MRPPPRLGVRVRDLGHAVDVLCSRLVTSATVARNCGSVGLEALALDEHGLVDRAWGRRRRRSSTARPDSPTPDCCCVSVLVPTLPPIMKATITNGQPPEDGRLAMTGAPATDRCCEVALARHGDSCVRGGTALRPDSRRSPSRTSGPLPEPDPEPLNRAADRAYARPCLWTSASSALVGRDHELEHIEASLDALARGHARRAWRSRASRGSARRGCSASCAPAPSSRGHLVLAGSAAEFERDMPFSVWVDALDAYVASQDLSATRR